MLETVYLEIILGVFLQFSAHDLCAILQSFNTLDNPKFLERFENIFIRLYLDQIP